MTASLIVLSIFLVVILAALFGMLLAVHTVVGAILDILQGLTE